jgi:8-oxo-dGTP pyrophosphatase MutT (NUDIX family)
VPPAPDAGVGPVPNRGSAGSGFRRLGEERRFQGWRISVEEATFEDPDGERFTRDIVRHPGAVAVVPLTGHGTVLLVRQYRGPIDRELLEIPAGTRDVDGEPPEVTARRELEEEAGVRAGHVELLATIYNSPGFCDEETLLYVAEGLEPGRARRDGHEERFLAVEEVALDDVDGMIRSGRLTDAQTVLGLLLARHRRAGRAP